MLNAGNVVVRVAATLAPLDKALAEGEQKTKTAAQRMSRSFMSIGKSWTLGVTTPITAAYTKMTSSAADLNETMSKTDVVFGAAAESVKAWGKTTYDNLGLAQQTSLDLAASYGDMATSMDITKTAAAKMSIELAGRAADLASFKNKRIDIIDTGLTGVFTGETESLKHLGVVMTQNNLQQFALAKGYKKTLEEMSESELVMLRYKYVMEKTSNAAGDYARTCNSVANRQRTVKEHAKEVATSFGQELQPAAAKVLDVFDNILDTFSAMSPAGKRTVLVIGGIAAAAGPLLIVSSKLITAWGVMSKVIAPLTVKLGAYVTAKTADTIASGNSLAASILTAAGYTATGTAAGGATPSVLGLAAATTLALGPFIAVAAAVAGTVAIVGKLTKEQREFRKETNELIGTLNESREKFNENIDVIGKKATAAWRLTDELFHLSEKQNKSNDELNQMKVKVEELNTLFPELSLVMDEHGQIVDETRESVKYLINEQTRAEQVKATEEQLLAITQKKIGFEKQLADAKEKYGENTSKYMRVTKNARETLADLNEEEKQHKEYLEANTDLLSSTIAAQEEAAEEEARILEERKAAQEQFNSDVKSAAEEHLSAMGSIYDEGIKTQEISLEQATTNLEKQVEQFNSWHNNIELVAKRVPPTVAGYLRELGPEAASLIADMTTASDEELKRLVIAIESKIQSAKTAAVNQVVATREGINTELCNTTDIETSSQNLGSAVVTNMTIGLAAQEPIIIEQMATTGSLYIDGLVQGLGDNAQRAYDKATEIASNIVQTIKTAWDYVPASKINASLASGSSDGGYGYNSQVNSNNHTTTTTNHFNYQSTSNNNKVNEADFFNKIKRAYL